MAVVVAAVAGTPRRRVQVMLAVTTLPKVTTVVAGPTSLLTWAAAVLAQRKRVTMATLVVERERMGGTVPKTTTELGRMNSVAAAVALWARPMPVVVVPVVVVTPSRTAPLEVVRPTRGAVAEESPIQPLLPLALAAQES
jgi:hypothetical protein